MEDGKMRTEVIHWGGSMFLQERAICGVRIGPCGARWTEWFADVTCKRCLSIAKKPVLERKVK